MVFTPNTVASQVSKYMANAVTVSNIWGNIINVKASPYLAKGDGVTDDTAAIQAAITEARTKKGVLFFPSGIYFVTETLDLQDIHTRGQGYRIDNLLTGNNTASVIKSSANPIITIDPYPGTLIQNIGIHGLGTTATIELWEVSIYTGQVGMLVGKNTGMMTVAGGDGFNVGGSGGIYLDYVSFSGNLGWGIYAYKLYGQSTLSNLFFTRMGTQVGGDYDHYGAMCFVGECVDINIGPAHIIGDNIGTAIKLGAKKSESDALDRFYAGPAHIRFTNVLVEGLGQHQLRQYFGTGCHFAHCMFGGDYVSIDIGEETMISGNNNRSTFYQCGSYLLDMINIKTYNVKIVDWVAEQSLPVKYWYNDLKITGQNLSLQPSGDKTAISDINKGFSNTPVAYSELPFGDTNIVPNYDDVGWTTAGGAVKGSATAYTLWNNGVDGHLFRTISGLSPGEVYTAVFEVSVTFAAAGTDMDYYIKDGLGIDIINNDFASSASQPNGTIIKRIVQFVAPASGTIEIGYFARGVNQQSYIQPKIVQGARNGILGDTDASQAEFATHLADTVTDADGVHGLKIEEGTWTPTLVGSTTAGSNTYSIQTGRYIRNGNLVTVWWTITLSLKDPTMAGDIYVGGLPFVTSNVNNFIFGATIGAVSNITLASGKTQLVMAAANNDSKIQILQVGSGVPLETVAAAAIANNTRIDGEMTYRIN